MVDAITTLSWISFNFSASSPMEEQQLAVINLRYCGTACYMEGGCDRRSVLLANYSDNVFLNAAPYRKGQYNRRRKF